MIGSVDDRISGKLARAAEVTSWDAAPAEVREQLIDLILDTLAVIACGGADPAIARFASSMAPGGRSTVVGLAEPRAACAAAQANGSCTTVHQLQDGHRRARGHPASHILPAALAVAEEQGASAERLLSACLAGYEVCTRLGIALNGVRSGLHDIGSWGVIGAAVAATYVITDASSARLAEAIDGAAAVTLYPDNRTTSTGATVHHLYLGLAASIGVTIAQGVAAGLGALAGTVDDFFGPRTGANFQPEKATEGIGADGRWSEWQILNGYFKIHPTCAHLHGVNDAVEEILSRSIIEPEEIERVDISVYREAMEYADTEPVNALAARFSMRYTVAAALRFGGLTFDSFNDRCLSDALVGDILRRIDVRHDPALDAGYPAGRPSVVAVSLRNGSRATARSDHPRGDATNPTSRHERQAKARSLLNHRFDTLETERIIAAVYSLAQGGSLTELSGALRAGGVNRG